MKKKFLKMLALMLCFVMLFAVPAFAANSPDTGNNSGNQDETEAPAQSGSDTPTQGSNSGAASPDTGNNSGNDETEAPAQSGNDTPTEAPASEETEAPVSEIDKLAEGVKVDKVIFNGVELEITIASVVSEDILKDAEAQAKALVNENASILKLFDISVPDGDYSAGIQIRFIVSEIQAGQNVSVLHQKKDGTWENLPVNKVEDGAVTATFTSFSPVAIVVSATAPGTGDDSSMTKLLVVLAAVAALSAGAFCVYRKKLSAN